MKVVIDGEDSEESTVDPFSSSVISTTIQMQYNHSLDILLMIVCYTEILKHIETTLYYNKIRLA